MKNDPPLSRRARSLARARPEQAIYDIGPEFLRGFPEGVRR